MIRQHHGVELNAVNQVSVVANQASQAGFSDLSQLF